MIEANTDERYNRRKRNGWGLLHSVRDIGMGILILAMGVLLFLGERLGLATFTGIDPWMKYLFGIPCLFYGIFRIYRGIKRDY